MRRRPKNQVQGSGKDYFNNLFDRMLPSEVKEQGDAFLPLFEKNLVNQIKISEGQGKVEFFEVEFFKLVNDATQHTYEQIDAAQKLPSSKVTIQSIKSVLDKVKFKNNSGVEL